jgi:sialate O-acetylesterase
VRLKNAALLALVSAMLCLAAAKTRAAATVSPMFQDHMVLQRDLPVPVWGWAEPGEKVTVTLDGQSAQTQADPKGAWRVDLKPLKADGKPHTLVIAAVNTIKIEDVLIGEVWFGSGQSNMAYTIGKDLDNRMDLPQVRLLHVPTRMERKPQTTFEATWKICTPETVADFSAVQFHFGRRLHDELKVPIGVVNASRGSTAIEQFMPPPKAGPLYNGSIAPVIPFAIRGVIWYQGEANVQQGAGLTYAEKLKTMLDGWRAAWGRDFSFYLVQLAPLKNYKADLLPPVWEAQTSALKWPGVGMTVSTDLAGNMTNIHPGNKKEYGHRLAFWALAKDYGRTGLECSGPLYKSMTREGVRVRLCFTHADKLKSSDGKSLTEFEIAGADGKYAAATATIDGNTIVVEAPDVSEPRSVRFAWKNAPSPNLINGAGLPAAPFRTEGWQGGAAE